MSSEDEGLDIPGYLRISQEERAQARQDWKGFPNQSKPVLDDRGPGSVARRLGYSDGINHQFVAELQAREAAERARRREEGLARLQAWKQQQAEISAVRAKARAQHHQETLEA
jgi:hypothetical protein